MVKKNSWTWDKFSLYPLLTFFGTRVLETHLGGPKVACIGPALSKFRPRVGVGATLCGSSRRASENIRKARGSRGACSIRIKVSGNSRRASGSSRRASESSRSARESSRRASWKQESKFNNDESKWNYQESKWKHQERK